MTNWVQECKNQRAFFSQDKNDEHIYKRVKQPGLIGSVLSGVSDIPFVPENTP